VNSAARRLAEPKKLHGKECVWNSLDFWDRPSRPLRSSGAHVNTAAPRDPNTWWSPGIGTKCSFPCAPTAACWPIAACLRRELARTSAGEFTEDSPRRARRIFSGSDRKPRLVTAIRKRLIPGMRRSFGSQGCGQTGRNNRKVKAKPSRPSERGRRRKSAWRVRAGLAWYRGRGLDGLSHAANSELGWGESILMFSLSSTDSLCSDRVMRLRRRQESFSMHNSCCLSPFGVRAVTE